MRGSYHEFFGAHQWSLDQNLECEAFGCLVVNLADARRAKEYFSFVPDFRRLTLLFIKALARDGT